MVVKMNLNGPPIISYLGISSFLFKVVCAWDPPIHRSYLRRAADGFYLIVMYFTSFMTSILCICHLYVSWDGDILYAAFNMVTFMVCAVQVVSIIWLRMKRKTIRRLVDFINDKFVFYSARGLANTTMAESYLLMKNVCLIFLACSMIGTQHWCILPLYIYYKTGERTLPLHLWYPFDVTQSPYYEIAYFFQYFNQIIVPISYLALTLFYVSACILTCGQLDILCLSLANIRFTAMLRRGVSHKQLLDHFQDNTDELFADISYFCATPVFQDSKYHFKKLCPHYNNKYSETGESNKIIDIIYSSIYDEQMAVALKECIQIHQMINVFFDEFQAFVSPILLFKMLEITLHHCILLYHFSFSLDFKVFEYYSLSLIELFCFCFFGHRLMLENENVSKAIFLSHWWCCTDPQILRTLRSYITISQVRSFIIQGGKFYNMNLYTFLMVIKAAYSFFTFMRNVQN